MSEPTTIDAKAKQRVKDALVARETDRLANVIDQVNDEHAAGELDQQDTVRTDGNSQAYEGGDLEGLFEKSAVTNRAHVDAIEALDFTPTDVVRDGALVGFAGQRYVVGVPVAEVEADGVAYAGISDDAPVRALIEGLRVGGTFTFNDQTHTIEFVA